MRSRITKPARNAPDKLWNIPVWLTSIPGEAQQNGLNEHGFAMFGHREIAALAHQLWELRGCPEGSPDEDWAHAAQQLRDRKESRQK